MIGLILSIFIFSLFVATAFWKCGVTPTLSETHYHLPKWAFPLAMIATAISALPYWLETNEQAQVLAFFSVAGVVYLGAAPLFKREDRKLHIASAVFAGVCALLWCLLTDWLITIICAVICGVMCVIWRKYWALILEIATFVVVYINLLKI